MAQTLSVAGIQRNPAPAFAPCEHRMVSKDGRIICGKIAEGDNTAAVGLCRTCPFRAVDCAHLRFSLSLFSPSPLIVRFNGRTEVWDDDPPRLRFQQAACAAKIAPVHGPEGCAHCPLRTPVTEQTPSHPQPDLRRQRGKVVAFPTHDRAAATG